MQLSKEKIIVIAIVSLFLASSMIQISKAGTTNISAKERLPAFLREVIAIDMDKYEMISEGYSVSYPSSYGGVVKHEVMSFDLNSSGSEIQGMGIFDNGFIYGIVFRYMSGSTIFLQKPSANLLDESRNIITRYRAFAQDYGIDTSHLTPALNMLNNVVELATSNTTLGNTKMEITCSTRSLEGSNNNNTKIAWIYTTDGIDVPLKCLSIAFSGNQITFIDRWGLYSVASAGILETEATGLAREAAENYILGLIRESNASIVAKPVWAEMKPTIMLSMTPGQIYNDSLVQTLNFSGLSETTRNPLTLYPLWQTVFYFNKSISGAVGVQVGIWGDTKEIAYCSAYGFHESSDNPTETAQPTSSPQTSDSLPNALLNPIIIVTIIASAVAIGSYAIKHRK